MKRFFCILVLPASMLVSADIFAVSGRAEEDIYPTCHAHAMIGYDSVINSRLGIPAELALQLARVDHDYSAIQKEFMLALSSTIMTAYQWQDSPGDYYIEVFKQCLDKAAG